MMLRVYIATTMLILAHTMSKGYGNLWYSSTPGKLLEALDSVTEGDIKSKTLSIPILKKITPKSAVKRRETTSKPTKIKQPPSTSNKRLIISDDNSAASASVETDDYERDYEKFVRNYFDDAANHYLIDDDNYSANESDEAQNFSGSTSYESESSAGSLDAVPYSSKKNSAKNTGKKCSKIKRKREICTICKNLRNGESSETCSYHSDNEPESYAYETQRKYRKTSDRDNSEDDESGDDEDDVYAGVSKEAKAESRLDQNIPNPENNSNMTLPSSSCIKRTLNGKKCFYCKDVAGIESIRCFSLNIPRKPNKIDNNTHQKRRIYKRTLSYVYEKGFDPNDSVISPEQLQKNETVDS